jgi:ribulose-bisphosphate carboxylase large chain
MGQFEPIFPTPGGGMSLESLPDLQAVYGQEVIYLIGGGLHRYSPDLRANVRHFLHLVGG